MRPTSLVLTDEEIANFGKGGYPDWGRVRATLQHLQSKWEFEHRLTPVPQSQNPVSDQMHPLPWHLSVYQFQEDGPVEFWLQDEAHETVAKVMSRKDAELILLLLNRRTSRIVTYEARRAAGNGRGWTVWLVSRWGGGLSSRHRVRWHETREAAEAQARRLNEARR